MTVVLDTNVVLSAILFGGKPRQVLEAALSGTVRLFVSEPIIAELQRVLQRPKFGISAQFIQTVVSEFTAIAEWVEPTEHFEVVVDDPTDNQFIDCAVAAKVDYIVTGDNHLLKLGQYGKIKIVNADSFTTILSKGMTERQD
jgi:putative PIN family toxin of toxin-antitoxin system